MSHLLDELVRAQKQGELKGIPSICSAHPWVLKAALQKHGPLLIESTCNQVNQYGGYSGMTPGDFIRFVNDIAERNKFPKDQLLLGGDHLGPSPWQEESADSAMSKAAEMVQSYVRAGFAKIHLDASMRLADDPPGSLDPETAASRTADLARIAEQTGRDRAIPPRYVIGTEVPTPGGAQDHKERVNVTTVENARHAIEITQAAFVKAGVEQAWERVTAMVVQPGVEFGDDFVLDYNPEAAKDLVKFCVGLPFVYEAHSTDYQKREALRCLVRDHFAILKVGPALTHAFREITFSLAKMENELVPAERRSNLVEVLEAAMIRKPEHWQKHYHGTPAEQAFARKYSMSDRIRFYWTDSAVIASLTKLLANLEGIPIPLPLVSQYAPQVFDRSQKGKVPFQPAMLIDAAIQQVLDDYRYACYLN